MRAFIILAFLALIAFLGFDNPIKYQINKFFSEVVCALSIREARTANQDHDLSTGAKVKTVQFDKEGIDSIALVTMIKDEDDIIYENLVWHFCVGFRKFIIVDNNSTDKTRMFIEKFRDETSGITTVIIIDNPIEEYIQSPFITSAMVMANNIWLKLEWIFPVDADEFWYPNARLKDILYQSHVITEQII